MNPHDDGNREGERRKQAAFDLHETHRERLVIRARRALLKPLLDGKPTVTADDVRDAVELPPGVNAKVFGSAPGALAKLGAIHCIGFTRTTRPTAHARPIQVWELKDRTKAEQWLREHPEPPPDDDPPSATVQKDLFPTDPNNNSGSVAATTTPEI